jgi:4'-phosphopantetheinyl transferase EntD
MVLQCSMSGVDQAFDAALGALSVPGILIGHRAIAPGDEDALLPEEAPAFAASVTKVRRASGAARIAAREILTRLGHPACALPKDAAGVPVWPAGTVGSLTHDARFALAAVASARDFRAVGIDVEPAELLPPELLSLIVTARERSHLSADPCGGRLLFVAKEAAYKAVYPLDRTFLEHHEVEVDLARQEARVRGGRVVQLRFSVSTRLVALAFIGAERSAGGA